MFKSLFKSKSSGTKKTIYTPIFNPFFTSVFLGKDNVPLDQVCEGLVYYRYRSPEIFNKIKETLKGLMPSDDIDNLDRLDEEMSMLDFFTIAMEYIQSNFPEEVKEIDLNLKKDDGKLDPLLGKRVCDLYGHVSLEYIIGKINALLLIPGQKRDGFIEYLTVERRNLAQLVFSEELSAQERRKYCDKMKTLMDFAKDHYDFSKELFTVQRLLFEMSEIVKKLEDGQVRNEIEEWIRITENIYLYWKWMGFSIQGTIQEDKADMEFYETNGCDLKIQVQMPSLPNVELSNRVLSELKILNERKKELENVFG